jgi:translation elongation factor P
MASYDTSDIRKGLKIMMDGSPYVVVEFQFVKPGKGAAFTRTKVKNLLTGAVLERNFRSGERFEPANVEVKSMQYLYKEGDSFVFMDTSTYDQVHIPSDTIGDAAGMMPEQLVVEVLFFRSAPWASRCRTSSSSRCRPPTPASAATPPPAPPSPPPSPPAPPSTSPSSSTSAT